MYTRKCPVCKETITHTLKENRNRAEGKRCLDCARKDFYSGPPKYKNVCVQCRIEVKVRYKTRVKKNWLCEKCRYLLKKSCCICGSPFQTRKYDNGNTCSDKCRLIYVAQKLGGSSVSNISQLDFVKKKKEGKAWFSIYNTSGKNNPMYGRTQSNETKQKIRLLRIERMKREQGQLIPAYNPKACDQIEKFGKQNGYNFQHAENGGEFYIEELGYWVDGYDEEKNVVVEYDELHHKRKNTQNKDKIRQEKIQKHLNCQFIRLQEQKDGTINILQNLKG